MKLLNPICAFVRNYFDVLNYHRKAERVLCLSTQWREGGRCPFGWLFTFVASMYMHMAILPSTYFLAVEPDVQVMMGNFTFFFFGLNETFNLIVFMIAFPIPLFRLLLYPYLSTNNYDSLLFVRHRITEQMALPASRRDKQFKMIHYSFLFLVGLFASGTALFIIFYNVMSMVYAFEHYDYFFTGWYGPSRFIILLTMMLHIDVIFIFLLRVFYDMYISIFYASMYTFKDLANSSALLARKSFRWSDLESFRHQHTLIVTRVFRMNSIVGNILLLYYIVNYPSNAYFLIFVLTKRNGSFVIKVLIVLYMIHQFCFIVTVHLLAASYSSWGTN